MKKWMIENKYGKAPSHSNYSKPINEELVTAAAGFVALVSAAGGMAALQMKMENPEYKAKHPKLAAFLDILGELGAEASKARTREQDEGGDDTIDDSELEKIEDELEGMFDIKGDCPVPGAEKDEAEPMNESYKKFSGIINESKSRFKGIINESKSRFKGNSSTAKILLNRVVKKLQ